MSASSQSRDEHLCVIIGMGASAGGLEAFRSFLDVMPVTGDMAFVMVQHLSPRHPSLLPELLARHTSMTVVEIEGTVKVEPDHVYVIPPNAGLAIHQGRLHTIDLAGDGRPHGQVDQFFQALAADQGAKSVGVVLSGTGRDGSLGLKAIKEAGGLTIAQNPEGSGYDGMPVSAAATGLVDHVLAVDQIPQLLVKHAAYLVEQHRCRPENDLQADAARSLPEVSEILQRVTGHDFSRYKEATLSRRLQRRVQIHRMTSVGTYLERLRKEDDEVEALFRDLLIGVTHFMRDPEAFEALAREVLDPLLKKSEAEQAIRIWVPACSSGEEAYSLAMLMVERRQELAIWREIQVFASDIDTHALEVARKGFYPDTIADQLSEARLQRFFSVEGDGYKVRKELRETCVFSVHSLIKDPPFSRLDLISCRNLLIYLEGELQRQVLPRFHYALKEDGYLFLGPAESATGYNKLFEPVDSKHRIYRRRDTVPTIPVSPLGSLHWRMTGDSPRTDTRPRPEAQNVLKSLERIILEQYGPACVVVNDQHDIIYFSGRTSRYLEPPAGAPTTNVISMARRGLRTKLRSGLRKVMSTRSPLTLAGVPVQTGEGIEEINLIIRPMPEFAEKANLFAIVFQELADRGDDSTPRAEKRDGVDEPETAELERELRVTREDLEGTIDQLETSNEQLKSSNEELMAMNEELQSANEEFETSKEELQSVNEEMSTINAELNDKVEELDIATSDLQNFFHATGVATLLLDKDLQIKRFTPKALDLFRLIPGDVGRPIQDIRARFDSSQLLSAVSRVTESGSAEESDLIRAEGDRRYVMKVLPYQPATGHPEGTVVTFTDVTAIRGLEEEIGREDRLVLHSWDAIIRVTPDGIITAWNPTAEKIFGFPEAEAAGQSLGELMVPPDAMESYQRTLDQLQLGEAVEPYESAWMARDKRRLQVSISANPITEKQGQAVGGLMTVRDVTLRIEAETARRESEERLRIAVREAGIVMGTQDRDLRYTWYYGGPRGYDGGHDLHGKTDRDVRERPEDAERIAGIKRSTLETGRPAREEIEVQVSGELRFLELTVYPIRDGQGEVSGINFIFLDVTDRFRTRERDRRLAAVVEESADAILTVDIDGIVTNWNYGAESIYGYTADEALGRPLDFLIPEGNLDERTWLVNAIHGAEPVRFRETERRRKDGSIATVLLTMTPLFDSRGRVEQVTLTERDITDRKFAEEALRASEARFQASLKGSPVMVYSQGLDLRYNWVNDAPPGFSVDRVLGKMDSDLFEDAADAKTMADLKRQVIRSGQGIRREVSLRQQGKSYVYDLVIEADRNSAGEIIGIVGVAVDITERRQIENQLRRAHKLQAVGKLAGGLAHEVNNMMQAVMGFGGIVRKRLGENHPERGDLDEMLNAARRAASLTHQLLAFSRQQVLQPSVLNVNEVVLGMQITLVRLLGADKNLSMELSPDAGRLKVDRAQLEGVLVNLVLNSRDAMSAGGDLRIQTENARLDDKYMGSHPGVEIRPGDYVMIAVSDTGTGMDSETRDQVMEPFFTTKPVGQGTGLGLSTVYGTVKQSGGYVWIYSEPGEGTTVKVYLPLVRDSSETGDGIPFRPEEISGNGEMILVVEDEEVVRRIIRDTLGERGFRVVEAENGVQGLEYLDRGEPVRLVICDVVMPVMSGKALGDQIRARYPHLPILFMSGYTGEDVVYRGLLAPESRFISKPFAAETLLWRVKETLDTIGSRE